MRVVKSAALYFAWVFGTGFLLGSIRVPLLVPRIGERYAELLEMPFMLVAIVVACRLLLRRRHPAFRAGALLAMGLIALALVLLAELLLAVVLQGRALGDYIASRDPVSGSAYLALLLLFALMPALIGRYDGPRPASPGRRRTQQGGE